MKTKHTPGPWVAPKGQVNLVCTQADWNGGLGDLAAGMQVLVGLKQGEVQAEANARLIAMAPTMATVMQSIYDMIQDQVDRKLKGSQPDWAGTVTRINNEVCSILDELERGDK